MTNVTAGTRESLTGKPDATAVDTLSLLDLALQMAAAIAEITAVQAHAGDLLGAERTAAETT